MGPHIKKMTGISTSAYNIGHTPSIHLISIRHNSNAFSPLGVTLVSNTVLEDKSASNPLSCNATAAASAVESAGGGEAQQDEAVDGTRERVVGD